MGEPLRAVRVNGIHLTLLWSKQIGPTKGAVMGWRVEAVTVVTSPGFWSLDTGRQWRADRGTLIAGSGLTMRCGRASTRKQHSRAAAGAAPSLAAKYVDWVHG